MPIIVNKLHKLSANKPTVILADTSGKVVYAGNFEKQKITKLIDKML